MNYICVISVVLVSTLAIIYDMKSFKIPNKLNLIGILMGLMYSILLFDFCDFLACIAGITIPIIILFPLFIIGAMGAGDIKLLSALGAFCHMDICRIIIYSLMLGAFAGVIRIAIRIARHSYKDKTIIHMSVPIGISSFIWCAGLI